MKFLAGRLILRVSQTLLDVRGLLADYFGRLPGEPVCSLPRGQHRGLKIDNSQLRQPRYSPRALLDVLLPHRRTGRTI